MEKTNEKIKNIHTAPPPVIHVSGSHLEIGRQIGEACREQVKHSIESTRETIYSAYCELELTWGGAKNQSKKYMPFAQERYPQYTDELKGIAEGANVDYEDVCVVNTMECVTTDALHLKKCTSFAVNECHTENSHVFAAHNEDWLPNDEQDVYLVHATPDDENPFLAMTYGALLPNIGLNAAGISQSCNSVYPNDARIGIPRVIVSRSVLGCRTPVEAINRMIIPNRAAGYNHLLAHERGELFNVEVSAKQYAILYGKDGYVVHANNFLDPQMMSIEADPDELVGSKLRYFRALRLLTQTPKHSVDTMQTILRDHINYPSSICNHALDEQNPMDSQKTINSLVMDLTDRVIYLAWGNPCENKYTEYRL